MNTFALFGVSILASLVSSVVAARLVAWPRLQDADHNRALTWLVAPHMFLRFIGLSLLVPGVVSPLLPAAFARPAAYGDFIAGMLAIVTTIALVNRTTWAILSVWLFNLWGVADFLFAFYQGSRAGLQESRNARSGVLYCDCGGTTAASHTLSDLRLARSAAHRKRARSQPATGTCCTAKPGGR